MPRYHYTLCGLDNVYIKNADFEEESPDGPILRIPGLRLLHTIIALAILIRNNPISNVDLKFLRTEFGLTERDWSQSLPQNSHLFADWELGRVQIPLQAEADIRDLFLNLIRDRSDHFQKYGVDISTMLYRAACIVKDLTERMRRTIDKDSASLVDDISIRVIRSIADREIEISHDGGGLYSIELD